MNLKFPKLMSFLGITSADSAVTEENMTSAEAKIAQLEEANAAAELAKKAAEDKVLEVSGQLTTAQNQVKTLEGWKSEQAAVDGSKQDESNRADEEEAPAAGATSFESIASSAIANRKRVLS